MTDLIIFSLIAWSFTEYFLSLLKYWLFKTALVYADYADVWFNYFWLDYWIQKSSHFATFRMLSVHLHWLYNVSTLSYTDRVITIVSPISTCCLSSRNELITHRHCQAVITLNWIKHKRVILLKCAHHYVANINLISSSTVSAAYLCTISDKLCIYQCLLN